MGSKVSIVLAAGLLACSMQALTEPPAAPAASATPATPAAPAAPAAPSAPTTITAPGAIVRFYKVPPQAPLTDKDGKVLPPPRICHLGTDCMTLDSRPFEMCQLSGKSCGDKLAEVLQVEKPKVVEKPAPPLLKTSH